MSQRNGLARNRSQYHGSPEWYTPPRLLDRIGVFLGPGWYDPCPASHGKLASNGLASSWRAKRVYCNPPYGRDIVPWIRKAVTEPVREIILLLPAYTDTSWFAPLFVGCQAIVFIRGRVRFVGPDGKVGEAPPHPSVLVYRGRRWRQFADAFSDLGPVMRTAVPMRAPAAQPMLMEAKEAKGA